MKNKLTLMMLALLMVAGTVMAQSNHDEEAIKKVVDVAYIEGLHNGGDLQATESGFHPGFNLLIFRNNMLEFLPIYNWIQMTKQRRKAQTEPDKEKTTCVYKNIDITGNAAVAKIELYRSDKLIFTDYLSLYKFEEGWRVVSKIYFRHP
ncbi:MAG: nuclear transport factor 2 family protein [Bacteroidales bacterium]|nr:nuclear transport factor 2 family protein [Bacteroidales bacterium]